MNLRGLLVLLVSLALAGVAASSANRWMSSRLANAGGDLSGVVAASADVPFGTQIDATLIKMVPLPREAIPASAFTDPKEVIGRVAATPLYKGEILLQGRVVEHLGGSALAAVVEEGKRAITVGVNEVVGVGGFLLPGNRVDLLAIRRQSGGDGSVSRTLLQNLKVLAVDQTTSPDKKDPVIVRSITLEVDPSQAEEIARATEDGKVRFTLRNPLDGNRLDAKPEGTPGLITENRPPAPQPPPPAEEPPAAMPETMVVIRGVNARLEPTGSDFARGLGTAR
ncbi:Flp pilus assembly protein CpaB [Thiocystis violacea]|uniref:Flp pilus assembly protein CpaB n=1 Tax=Thiocystis violacea TaxID=13725 RepID=UPI0019066A19|nr:Flp pilus assembly protein CpaB [Thiocystis violacea]MBK1718207.1 Flp pilus assembly protein CpaB [Thiocystis violacea]